MLLSQRVLSSRGTVNSFAVFLEILAPESNLGFQRVLHQKFDKPRRHAAHNLPRPDFALVVAQDDDLVESFQLGRNPIHASIACPTNPVYLGEIGRERGVFE
jgi:hypothetical protein